jgi:hypothetical protein
VSLFTDGKNRVGTRALHWEYSIKIDRTRI